MALKWVENKEWAQRHGIGEQARYDAGDFIIYVNQASKPPRARSMAYGRRTSWYRVSLYWKGRSIWNGRVVAKSYIPGEMWTAKSLALVGHRVSVWDVRKNFVGYRHETGEYDQLRDDLYFGCLCGWNEKVGFSSLATGMNLTRLAEKHRREQPAFEPAEPVKYGEDA
jgi:hypothetical protein